MTRFRNSHAGQRGMSRVVLDVFLVAAVVTAALVVRYADPLASSVLPAEDPFTHLVFTREHVDRGYFDDSFHLDTGLYPPGLHAFTGIFWMLSGVELYDMLLYAAPLFGGLGAAGAFLLGRRFGGPATGVAAGLLIAFIPEHAFRSNIYVPTAFDLALIPFLLLAFMEVAEGARAWAVPGILVALALLFAHPWVIPLTMLPIAGYAIARPILARWHRTRGSEAEQRPHATRRPLLAAGLALGSAVALVAAAFRYRWDQSDTGFSDVGGSLDFALLFDALWTILNPVTLIGLAAVIALVTWLARSGRDFAARTVAALGIAGFLAVALPTLTYSPPLYVDYAYQLGWLPIGLALLALVAWPFTPANRVTLLGAALVAVSFPLTAINVFNSPFIPHRTVAYLSVGVAILGAGFVATVTSLLTERQGETPERAVTRRRGRAAFAVAVLVVLGLGLAGPGAATPDSWYRYYEEDDFEGFRFVDARLEENEYALAVSADWRPNMVLKSMAPDMRQVVYSEAYYTDGGEREKVHRTTEGPVYVIVDEYVAKKFGEPGFVHDPAYRVAWQSADGEFTVYVHGGG